MWVLSDERSEAVSSFGVSGCAKPEDSGIAGIGGVCYDRLPYKFSDRWHSQVLWVILTALCQELLSTKFTGIQ